MTSQASGAFAARILVHPRVSVQICTDFTYAPVSRFARLWGGTLGISGSIKPGAYHFWGIIDSPCFCANKLRGSIGNLTCMSIGVARPERHARTRAGFPQKFGRWVNSMGKGELHTTERTFHQTINPMGTGGQARGDRRDLHSENNSRPRGRLIL